METAPNPANQDLNEFKTLSQDIQESSRIMIVDDEKDMAELICQMFRKEIQDESLSFSFAENGVRALETLELEPETDVVLSDINMPKMDGITLLSQLNDKYPLLRTIIVTAYGDMSNIRAAMNRGAFDFLNKPIQAPDLKVTLNRAISTVKNLKTLESAREQALADQQRIQNMAMENARASGRAEYATSVLHNISNVLNSLSTSCARLRELVKNPGVDGLRRANEMLEENLNDLERFFAHDEKGEKLARFYLKIGDVMNEVSSEMLTEIESLSKRSNLMADFIEAQQYHEKTVAQLSALELIGLVKESIKVKENALRRNGVQILTHFERELTVQANRSMLIQVIINLIQNSIEAMSESQEKVLSIIIAKDETGRPFCRFSDTGEGIANPQEIFARGFTTKQTGHGYGLHFSFKAMQAMGGNIEVESGQPGEGASFTLFFSTE